MATFEAQVTLPADIEQVFDFLIRPANAQRISPPDLGLTIVGAPEVLQQGSRLEVRVQAFGQVQMLIYVIERFVRPQLFVEAQVKGPFRLWRHEHRLEQIQPGQVLVTDHIDFEPPGGLLGLLVTASKVLDQLEDGFYHRHEELKKVFASPSGAPSR